MRKPLAWTTWPIQSFPASCCVQNMQDGSTHGVENTHPTCMCRNASTHLYTVEYKIHLRHLTFCITTTALGHLFGRSSCDVLTFLAHSDSRQFHTQYNLFHRNWYQILQKQRCLSQIKQGAIQGSSFAVLLHNINSNALSLAVWELRKGPPSSTLYLGINLWRPNLISGCLWNPPFARYQNYDLCYCRWNMQVKIQIQKYPRGQRALGESRW